jgi:antitoxin ParD1/3/4
MTVKASVSVSEAQAAFARRLVEEGRYASLSAVVQRGLELLRAETEAREAEVAGLRALLAEREAGGFTGLGAGRAATEAAIAAKRRAHGL